MGAFDLVVASPVPRTLETAIAMGFAVDAIIATPTEIESPALAEVGHHERWGWEHPWVRFAEIIRGRGPVAHFGMWLRDSWTGCLASIPEGGRLLVVSHGRHIESGVVTCLDEAEPTGFASWGAPLHQGEGVRMAFDGERFRDPLVLLERRCEEMPSRIA